MLQAATEKARDSRAENAQLHEQLEQLRVENAGLRRENRDLRATLDAYVARAASTPLYGSHELTAGTCVGPRRQRDMPRRRSDA